jgi:hypothetical protein
MKLSQSSATASLVKIILLSMFLVEVANAQLIFAARHVIGRINQMTQEDSNGNSVSQFATVIIVAPANKVYATAVNVATQNSALTIVSQDSQSMKMKVSEGAGNAAISVLPLSDSSSEIMVSATPVSQNQAADNSTIVNSIMKICNQLNRVCKPGAN